MKKMSYPSGDSFGNSIGASTDAIVRKLYKSPCQSGLRSVTETISCSYSITIQLSLFTYFLDQSRRTKSLIIEKDSWKLLHTLSDTKRSRIFGLQLIFRGSKMRSWEIIIPSNHGIALRISNYLKINPTNVAAYEALLVGFIFIAFICLIKLFSKKYIYVCSISSLSSYIRSWIGSQIWDLTIPDSRLKNTVRGVHCHWSDK
jgi:hypothetical protein